MRVEWMTWHRRLGVAAAVLVILVCVTGVLINHGHALGLDRQRLQAVWLQRLYGLAPPEQVVALRHDGVWWSQWGGELYRDGDKVDVPPLERLLGVFPVGSMLGVVDRGRFILLDTQGALVDVLDYPFSGVALRAGLAGQGLAIELHGGQRLRLRADAAGFEDAEPAAPSEWATPGALPEKQAAVIRGQLRGDGVAVERMLLDLHSGRWLGAVGPWLMDLAAIVLLVLAATGVSTAWQRWRRLPP